MKNKTYFDVTAMTQLAINYLDAIIRGISRGGAFDYIQPARVIGIKPEIFLAATQAGRFLKRTNPETNLDEYEFLPHPISGEFKWYEMEIISYLKVAYGEEILSASIEERNADQKRRAEEQEKVNREKARVLKEKKAEAEAIREKLLPLKEFSDEDLTTELRNRGYQGEIRWRKDLKI
jgi:hypothetical protein